MPRRRKSNVYLAVPLVLVGLLAWGASGQEPPARRGMVASVHPLATESGLSAFRAGGNAVDAAVATALTLGVVDGHNSGIGGGCFVVVRSADGQIVTIDGRETAPAAATRDMFVEDGKVVDGRSTTGPLAVGVPGALAAYEQAIGEFGQLSLARLLRTAAKIAEEGFRVDRIYASKLATTRAELSRFPASRKMLLKPDGEPFLEGEILKLPDLARSYRNIAENSTDWFYDGAYAERVGNWMADHDGLVTADDFRSYEALTRTPIRSQYRGYEIVGMPPPSSGGIHIAQMLNILECFPLSQWLRDDPAQAHHVVAEAMKLAFADRAHWLGDADFAKVPKGLVDKAYGKQLAARVDLSKSTPVASHGLPPNWQEDLYGKHTTHIATADAAGNWVAITATVNTTFGSKVVVPETGIVLNNEMDDFSSSPGTPNAFGLVGAEANAVAPGKRPLSSMSPTIVLKDGIPVLTVGGAGGPKIITEVLLAIIRYVDGEVSVQDAISEPRIHHQWRPDILFVENTLAPSLQNRLRSFGHQIQELTHAGVAQGISQRPNGPFIGQSDPRVPGLAKGF